MRFVASRTSSRCPTMPPDGRCDGTFAQTRRCSISSCHLRTGRADASLRDQGTEATIVPTGERSLDLFGDEKRLDVLRRNRRLFAPGRLSLEMLRARLFAPPFAYRRIGQGGVALVLENVATYHSALA